MSAAELPMNDTALGDDADVRFEVLVGRLQEVVRRLETGDQSLEASLDDFESGMNLAARASTILDAAEGRVDKLLATRDGEFTEAPLYGAA